MIKKIFSIVFRAVYAFSGLALTFFLARNLNIEVFAYYNGVASLVSIAMPLMAMASSSVIMRQGLSSDIYRNNRFVRVVKFELLLSLVVIFFFGIFFGFSLYFWVVLISGVNIIIFSYSELNRSQKFFYKSFLYGNGAPSTAVLAQGLVSLLFAFIIIFVFSVKENGELLCVFMAANLSALVAPVISIYFKNCFNAKINIKWIVSYLKLGVPISISGLLFSVISVQEILFLKYFSNDSNLAEYSLLTRVTSVILVVFTVFSTFSQPYFLALFKKIQLEKNIKSIRYFGLSSFFLCFFVYVFLSIYGKDVICYFGGDKFCSIDQTPIYIRGFALLIYAGFGFSASVLMIVPGGGRVLVVRSLISILIFWISAFFLPVHNIQNKISLSFLLSYVIYAIILYGSLKLKTGYSFSIFENIRWIINDRKITISGPG